MGKNKVAFWTVFYCFIFYPFAPVFTQIKILKGDSSQDELFVTMNGVHIDTLYGDTFCIINNNTVLVKDKDPHHFVLFFGLYTYDAKGRLKKAKRKLFIYKCHQDILVTINEKFEFVFTAEDKDVNPYIIPYKKLFSRKELKIPERFEDKPCKGDWF